MSNATEVAPSVSEPNERGRSLGVIPGLDGIRAVAVLAVMAFHAGVTALAGGLLGVDVFFVLSGFLVTSLLLAEHSRSGTISLRGFWAKRARRLLPALFVLFIGICAFARWTPSGNSPAEIRGDALATLAYVANWHYILTGQNYFVRFGAPSPLLHTWSLAVEEQFYLVWPIIALLVLKRWGRRALGWTAGLIMLASAVTCAALFQAGSSVNRLYYGTDTRAQTIMVGALLAVVLHGSRERVPTGPSRRVLGAAGVVGAVGLGYCLHAVEGSGSFLYEGGFLVVALTAAAVVCLVVVRPDHVLSRVLSWSPLRYIGRISYGLYLYHWPLFIVLTEPRTGLQGWELLVIRFAVTWAAADLSYRLIERPIRAGRLLPRIGLVALPVALVTALVVVTVAPGAPAQAAVGPAPAPGYVGPGRADSAHPERALLLGDSMALTLGVGLSNHSQAWGVSIDNQGVIGCDLDPDSSVKVNGNVTPTAQGCPDWRTNWAQLIARTDPDVVVVLLGRWESLDRIVDGAWTHVGDPGFDAHLTSELSQVIDITSARGAKVVFLTLPYIAQTTVQANGAPWDMNLPSRTNAYNADVRAAVAQHPGVASVVDLNQMLDPGGHYVSYIDGVRVRNPDDEHISTPGGEWLRPRLLPAIAAAGASTYDSRTGR